MDPKTTEIINTTLTSLIESVTAVKDFAVQQIPDVLQQLLQWELYSSLIYGGIGVVLFLLILLGYVLLGMGLRWDAEYTVVGGWMALILMIPSFIFMSNFMDALKIYLAPKLFLLEYAVKLVK